MGLADMLAGSEKEAEVLTPSKRASKCPVLVIRKVDSPSYVPIVESTAWMFIHGILLCFLRSDQDQAKPCRYWCNSKSPPGHTYAHNVRMQQESPGECGKFFDPYR